MPDRRPKPDRPTPLKEKLCKTCRRPILWTPQRARDWDVVKYCSETCGGYRIGEKDAALEVTILEILAEHGAGQSIDPAEAAKLVGGHDSRRDWESLLEPARAAARRLAAAGKIAVLQHGKPVDVAVVKGPFLVRLSQART
jgi:hypothetical protein